MKAAAIIEIDVHGLRVEDALRRVEKALIRAGSSTYRIRVIHGYSHGSAIRDALSERFAADPALLRIERGVNPGVTELVLREY